MIETLKKHFILLVCGIMLVSYHCVNLLGPGHTVFPSQKWESQPISVETEGHAVLELPTVSIVQSGRFKQLDWASRLISGSGYVLRYLAGQLPDWVIAGRKDSSYRHFYLRGEVPLQYLNRLPDVQASNDGKLRHFCERLRRAGIQVVVAVVPTKIALERDYLPTLPGAEVWTSEMDGKTPGADLLYRKEIEANSHYLIDLLSEFQAVQRAQPKDLLFVPGDQHWSSFGVAVTASAVIKKLKADGWDLRDPKPYLDGYVGFEGIKGFPYRPELLTALLLPAFYVNHAPELRWNEPLYNINVTSPSPRKGRLIILGTSYSDRLNRTPYGLGPLLSKSLRMELIDRARPSAGPTASIRALVQEGIHLRKGDLVVWEFPIWEPLGDDIQDLLIDGVN